MDAVRTLRSRAGNYRLSTPTLFLATLLLATGLSITSLNAQVPETMSYQGHLVGPDGSSAADGIYQIEIVIYDRPEGGTSLWRETHNARLVGGVFSLTLGSRVPLDIPFDRPYWLAVAVAGDREMTPRTELSSSPYAFRSGVAESLAGGAVSNINGLDGPVRIVGAGATTVTQIDGVITIMTAEPKGLQGGAKVEIGPNSAQSSADNNSVLHLNETNRNAPNLIEMEVGGSDVFVVANNGDVTTNGEVASNGLANSGVTKLGDGAGADNLTVNVGTGSVSFTGARLQNVGDPTAAQDAATKKYVDDEIAGIGSVGGEPLLTFGAGSGDLTDNRVVTAGTGVAVTDAGVDNGTYTIAIGQDVATTASPTFGGLTVTGNAAVGANLTVTDDAYVGGDATVVGELTIQDETLMLGALTVGDDVEITDDLEVGGDAEVVGDLSVSGAVDLPVGSIDNAELANSSVNVLYGSGLSGDASVALGGTLNLSNTGVTSLAGTLNQVNVSGATGDVTLSLPQNIDAAATPTFGGLTVTTNAAVGANLTVTDDLFVGGDLTVTGELTIEDEVLILDALTVADDLEVTDDLDVGGDADIAGDLSVSGAVDLPVGSIDNAELANSSVNVLYGSGLSGDASVALGGTLNLSNTGVTSLAGTLNQVNVSGATGDVTLSLPQNIDATAAPTFGGLTVTGNAAVGANLTVTDDLFVNGDATILGEITVDEITTVGDIDVGESLDVTDDIDVGGDGDIGGNLEVGGDLEVVGDFDVSGATTLDGTTTVNAMLEVENSTTALHIKDGGVRLSTATYTAKDLLPDAIGTGAAVAIVNATSGVGTKAITVPTGGTTGEVIIVTNSTTGSIDLTGTAAGTITIASGEGLSILYDGSNWIVLR